MAINRDYSSRPVKAKIPTSTTLAGITDQLREEEDYSLVVRKRGNSTRISVTIDKYTPED